MIEQLNAQQSWELLQKNSKAVLIDVRTKIEYAFVGHPKGAVHIPWKEAPDWQLNPHFVEEVKNKVPDTEAPILLLCRSGQRSQDAARALEDAGYRHLVNVVEGFEGPLDQNNHRGNLGGWRFHGLPWEQS